MPCFWVALWGVKYTNSKVLQLICITNTEEYVIRTVGLQVNPPTLQYFWFSDATIYI
jgi:hypothetical protein